MTDTRMDNRLHAFVGWTGDRSTVFLTMLCLIATLEGADMMLLGATFHALERDLGILPVHLASLAMAQALLQAFSGPAWGVCADRGFLRRKTILAIGCTGWGIVTIGLGRANSLRTMLMLRAANGVLLGTMSPMVQGIVADVISPERRGKVFGAICCSNSVGAVMTSLIVTPLSHRIVFDEPGWRVAFLIIGLASVFVGSMVITSLTEPPRQLSSKRTVFAQPQFSLSSEAARIGGYFKIPTFLVLCGQGLFGTVPWNALSFTTMFYQLSGFTDIQAASLASLGILAGGLGQLLGGNIGDWLEKRYPLQGRPLTAQISVLCGIPFVYLLFIGLPQSATDFWPRALLVFCFFLTATWCCAGVNRPILSEIVDSGDRTSIFAWMLALEGSFGALFGAPLVAFLAQHLFGYSVSHPHAGATGPDPDQAKAMGTALALVCCCFWSVCFLLYTFLHCTYKKDILRARAENEDEYVPVMGTFAPQSKRDVRA
jgi:MFS family permease